MNQQNIIAKRQANVEVLRVVAMLFIVTGHYLNFFKNNDVTFCTSSLGEMTNYALLQFVFGFACTGVDLFVLITGYFLIERLSFRIKGMIHVGVMTIFYSLAIYLGFCYFGAEPFSLKRLMVCLEPIPTHQYWFVAKYIGLLLVAPFLSKLASGLEKKDYIRMLIILFVLFFKWPYGEMFGGGMSLSWFCFLFLVGGYVRKYGLGVWVESHLVAIIIVVSFGIFALHAGACYWDYQKNGAPFDLRLFYNNSFTFILALPLFVWFVRRPMNGSFASLVSRVAPYTFGVYLVHAPALMSEQIWGNIAPSVFPSLPLYLHVIIASLVVFVGAVLVDILRDGLFRLLRIP